ncbi:uncharacterized protein LOC131012963 [Salvia miltiorrhiza]|uniref:uncharacterized protein LOC131012963 n=1 Tax=Salvia miltiorrhiza TaxID=226208 RepID=UPI0025AC519F|nr:uncharacterized protein LOC131012963 [Salvia miltiorrhiza]
MNYHDVGSSYIFSSSSSSSDELEEILNECDVEHQLMCQHILSNNFVVASLIENQNATTIHRGSVPGRRMIHRDREVAAQRLFNDYFSENPTFNEGMFRRRFRMSRSLFHRIVDAVKNHNSYFQQGRDCTGRLGLSTLQKITAAFRILAYGVPADATDEYINIGESTAIKCVKKFCRAIVEIFSSQYLRSPTSSDVARLLYIGQQRGFPGIGITPPANYVIQGKEYSVGYYLADGIYPKWSTLVQTIHEPRTAKKKHFATRQESCRKDVERAFGVLQSRFAIVANPARFWQKKHLELIMKSCIIMHNMIIEDERDLSAPIQEMREVPTPDVETVPNEARQFQEFLARYRSIKDKSAHLALRDALVDHLWEEYSNFEH